MLVELHILQNFAPSNLNRDDTGMPKDCEFGGWRRARISSQCLKRAIRTEFKNAELLPVEDQARRSKHFVDEVSILLEEAGKKRVAARRAVTMALGSVGILSEPNGDGEMLSEYLLFLGHGEIQALRDYCIDSWAELQAAYVHLWGEDGTKSPGKDRVRTGAPRGARRAVGELLDGGKSADLALFGRMIADLPSSNLHAASQVAHAISTNRISMEWDYYTAVDDLKPEDTAGAGMIGTVGFNSSCFYRYANVDIDQLSGNLRDDRELAIASLRAFIRASINAIPSGKQNSMAAHNPPSMVLAVVRTSQLWNLANAFLRPVAPSRDRDLSGRSIDALDSYWGRLSKMYGADAIVGTSVAALDEGNLENLRDCEVAAVDDLIENVQTWVRER